MQTYFFKQVAKMDINSKLTFSIAKATSDTIVVSIFIESENCGDKAKNIIPPFNVTGTAEELDTGFFEHIRKPIQQADGLISNMESFLKQLEEAKMQSAMEKEKSDKDKKEKESKAKKYKDDFGKAEALEKEGKYKEAWSALPKVSEHPDFALEIRKKQDEYEKHFSNLFTEVANVELEP